MCDLCYGTHVVYEIDSFFEYVYTCPNCGPEPEEKFRTRMDDLQRRIELVEKDFEKKGA
ncbi:hypothetical protein PB1_16414 [Bacillus methanolicus PB1]|uniref:Uncharacterized protein n=1 Tax=Bacillus methanolicus PB1 TaxID=997296 RepID=I3DY37_BACMT|nr:hypothetical protein [Bacillus methanolicus]EIJ79158.1 hypothetical protein PB1_16414 [Bacillus methanolicus PB1]